MKKIKKIGECHAPTFGFQRQKVFSLGHIYFLRDKQFPVEFWYTYFTRKVNLTNRENFLISNVYKMYHKRTNAYAVAWHSPILILFLDELFSKSNHMLSIGLFGRRASVNQNKCWAPKTYVKTDG